MPHGEFEEQDDFSEYVAFLSIDEAIVLHEDGIRRSLTQDEAVSLTLRGTKHELSREDVVELLDDAVEAL